MSKPGPPFLRRVGVTLNSRGLLALHQTPPEPGEAKESVVWAGGVASKDGTTDWQKVGERD